jgi:hypothetical protein
MPFKDPEVKAKWLAASRARRTEQARLSRKHHAEEINERRRVAYELQREEINAKVRADRLTNPEKYRERDRARYLRRREKQLAYGKSRYQNVEVKRQSRNSTLLRDFGISLEQWDRMLVACDGRCEICHAAFERPNEPHVDHCHKTGAVRGLLCNHCNYGLGFFKDNPNLLIQAASYLKEVTMKE